MHWKCADASFFLTSNEITQSLKIINTSSLDGWHSTLHALAWFYFSIHQPVQWLCLQTSDVGYSGSVKRVYLQLRTSEFLTLGALRAAMRPALGSVAIGLNYSFHRGCMMLCENRVVLRDKNVCENMICCPFLFLNCFWLEVKASRLTAKPSQGKLAWARKIRVL